MGALTAFGSMAVAIPFLLDFFDLPADQFQLYLLGSVVTARFATGLAALHGFVVTLLVACAVVKHLKWHRLMQAIAVHLSVTFGVMIAVGFILTSLIPYKYEGVKTFETMAPMQKSVQVIRPSEFEPISLAEQKLPRLDVILARKVIRVGYHTLKLPYVFQTKDVRMVGFDVEMLNELASDLDIKIAFYKITNKKREAELLSNGSIDISIGGHSITPKRATRTAFSDSYTYHTAGLLITDSRRNEFSTVDAMNEMPDLHLAVGGSKYYRDIVKDYFPHAKLTQINNVLHFLKGDKYKEVDAFVFSTEAASAWSMLYSDYSAVIPKGLRLRAPVGFVLPKAQVDYVQFINTWLKLKEENGFKERVYQHWILGENPKAIQPRWSIMKDVLDW
jgi:ABC-type amino acid transport substrate-binding protein